ncbi:MAG: PGPGW domain-containing protein [Oleiphilaceae bacterium]|nr:PGPGW domain-containing protein [Oleiphilaceae bacterium]
MMSLIEWFQTNDTLLWWLGGLSLVMFLGTLIALPVLVVRIPSDYFVRPVREKRLISEYHPLMGLALLLLKNGLGLLLLLAGIAMLVLPGQGLITIFVALTFLNFPGKYRLERWVISRGPVFRSINWIRERRGYRPLDPGNLPRSG